MFSTFSHLQSFLLFSEKTNNQGGNDTFKKKYLLIRILQ